MNSKAFSPMNVLIYILALLVGALILFYGYKAISQLSNQGDRALYIRFQSSLQADIKEISSLPGTIRIKEYSLPSRFNKVCFFDLKKENCANPGELSLSDSASVICDSVKASVANIFVLPLQEKDIKISEIELEQSPLCIDIPTGLFKVKITGKGRTALLSSV
jgi:hypothetical protein